MTIWYTLLYSYLQFLLLLCDSFAQTSLASVFFANFYPLSSTLLADCLRLSKHAHANLHDLHHSAFAITASTYFGVITTSCITIRATSNPCKGYLLHHSIINLFKCHLHFHKLRLHLLWTFFLSERKPEALASSRRTTVIDSFLAILIIQMSFLRIQQTIVSFFESFKLVRVTTLVRMFL